MNTNRPAQVSIHLENDETQSAGSGPTRRAFCAGMGIGLVGAMLLSEVADADMEMQVDAPAVSSSVPSGLLCELLAEHEGVRITTPRPMFAWIVPDAGPNTTQTAYSDSGSDSQNGKAGSVA